MASSSSLREHVAELLTWEDAHASFNPEYRELNWPDDYWPPQASPPGPGAWADSIEQFRRDRAALQRLGRDARIEGQFSPELETRVPRQPVRAVG